MFHVCLFTAFFNARDFLVRGIFRETFLTSKAKGMKASGNRLQDPDIKCNYQP